MRVEWLERLRANLGGYFWLSCPNCGHMFGGQESKRGEILWNLDLPGYGLMTCTDPVCKEQVRARNQKNGLPDGAWVLAPIMEDTSERIVKQVLDHHAPEEFHVESNRRSIARDIVSTLDKHEQRLLKPDVLGKIKAAIMGVTLTPEQAQEVIQLVKLCVPPATMDDCEKPSLAKVYAALDAAQLPKNFMNETDRNRT